MSISLNKVILQGRVGQKPRVQEINDRKVAQFSLATSYGSGETQQTEWHNIVAWSPVADLVEKYVDKGRELLVEGRIRTRKYTNSTGEDRSITEILANNIQFGADPNRNNVPPAPDAPLRTARRMAQTQAAPAATVHDDDMPELI